MVGVALATLLVACSGGSPPPQHCCPIKVTPSRPLVLSRVGILRRLAQEYRATVQRDLSKHGGAVSISRVRVARVARFGKAILLYVRPGGSVLLAMGRAMRVTFFDRFRAHGIRWIGIRTPGGRRAYVRVRVLRRYAADSITKQELMAAVRSS